MDKKRKDSVIRATVDRAALLRGVLMLTALALLLCFGLKPSRAAAPDAEDGALTASDASARLSAECELLQRVTFSPCGHEMTRRQRLPAELAGMTKDELAAKYDQWVITSFSPAQGVGVQLTRNGTIIPANNTVSLGAVGTSAVSRGVPA